MMNWLDIKTKESKKSLSVKNVNQIQAFELKSGWQLGMRK